MNNMTNECLPFLECITYYEEQARSFNIETLVGNYMGLIEKFKTQNLPVTEQEQEQAYRNVLNTVPHNEIVEYHGRLIKRSRKRYDEKTKNKIKFLNDFLLQGKLTHGPDLNQAPKPDIYGLGNKVYNLMEGYLMEKMEKANVSCLLETRGIHFNFQLQNCIEHNSKDHTGRELVMYVVNDMLEEYWGDHFTSIDLKNLKLGFEQYARYQISRSQKRSQS